MKSIIIVAGVFPKRSETFISQHALGLVRRGWKVYVLSMRVGDGISGTELNELDRAGIRRIYTGFGATNIWKYRFHVLLYLLCNLNNFSHFCKRGRFRLTEIAIALKYAKKIYEINADIMHVHFGSIAAPLSQVGVNVRTVVTWHGIDANVIPKIRGSAYYNTLKRSNFLNSVGSDFMINRLKELGFQNESIKKIPMGVDTSKFYFVERNAEINVPFQIISVGRLDEMKGHAYLIEACHELSLQGYDISLKIIGDGCLHEELESQINRLDLADKVELLGGKTTEQVRTRLVKADLFALAGVSAKDGRVETQGVAIIEAQATGLPVVTCDVGGVSESMIDRETGILCESKNIEEIVSAIRLYINNLELRLMHGSSAREFVTGQFSIEKMIDRFEETYAEIVL